MIHTSPPPGFPADDAYNEALSEALTTLGCPVADIEGHHATWRWMPRWWRDQEERSLCGAFDGHCVRRRGHDGACTPLIVGSGVTNSR